MGGTDSIEGRERVAAAVTDADAQRLAAELRSEAVICLSVSEDGRVSAAFFGSTDEHRALYRTVLDGLYEPPTSGERSALLTKLRQAATERDAAVAALADKVP